MTDLDGSGQVPRRSTRTGDGGAPVSGALAIVLAVVAVVVGFLILNSLSGDGDEQADFPAPGNTSDSDVADDTSDGATDPDDTGGPTLPPTTTIPPIATEVPVIVANANGTPGSAGRVTTVLEAGAGFTTVQATNANTQVDDLEASVIYFDAAQTGAQATADSLNRVLGGGLLVQQKPEVAPVSDGDLRGAGVLLMLGKDKVNITVDELDLPSTGDAPAITNPPTGGTAESTGDG